jgi:coenzyme F420-0:L-glutamate ligase / coenzyme F420-1:gamma-L-glutamate ligase
MSEKFDLGIFALRGLPEVFAGANLADLICAAAADRTPLRGRDIVVLAQKIVSKAEGRLVLLADLRASPQAVELAQKCNKDPRLVELVLRESSEIVRCVPDILIARHRLGFVVANAAIDHSNVPGNGEQVLLLPVDPDGSAARLREDIRQRTGADIAVIISDSFGRPWRNGTCGVAIGCAGIEAFMDRRGGTDRNGRTLTATVIGHADEIAAAASIVMGQADEGVPAVIVRGADLGKSERMGCDLVRPLDEDLFR